MFTARLYAPGEAIPLPNYATIAEWRRTSLQRDGSLRFGAPQAMVGPAPIPPAIIPAAVVSALPAEHVLCVEWELQIGGPR